MASPPRLLGLYVDSLFHACHRDSKVGCSAEVHGALTCFSLVTSLHAGCTAAVPHPHRASPTHPPAPPHRQPSPIMHAFRSTGARHVLLSGAHDPPASPSLPPLPAGRGAHVDRGSGCGNAATGRGAAAAACTRCLSSTPCQAMQHGSSPFRVDIDAAMIQAPAHPAGGRPDAAQPDAALVARGGCGAQPSQRGS